MPSLKTILRRSLLRGDANLQSRDDPYAVLAGLVDPKRVACMVDAGASDGRTARRLLERFPAAHVHAFEPQSVYRTALEAFARADERFHPDFRVLSDHPHEARLHVTRSAGVTSLYEPTALLRESEPDGSVVESVETVPAVTLDAYVTEQGIDGVHVMKLDIQGGELAALQGAATQLREHVLAVYTEVLFNPLYERGALFHELDAFLRSCGFVLFNLYKPAADDRGMLLWGNAVYVHAERVGG
jgi:FkbM family methyltransferase